MSPREEFGDALQSVGALVAGPHPTMDGKTHRIAVTGDKKGNRPVSTWPTSTATPLAISKTTAPV